MNRFEIASLPQYRWLTSDQQSNIAFDVMSSSLLELDDLTLSILQSVECNEADESIIARLSEHFSVEQVTMALGCIEEKINSGELLPTTTARTDQEHYAKFCPSALILNISEECQLACRYCFANGGDYSCPTGNMSVETAKRAIDMLRQYGDRAGVMISLFGGEPLMNWEVFTAVVEYAEEVLHDEFAVVAFGCTTNAIGMTSERAAFFKLHNIDPMISIDGSEAVHNNLRPTRDREVNSWQASMEGIKLCQEAGVNVTLRATITSASEDIRDLVALFREHGITKFNFQPITCAPEDPLALGLEALHEHEEQAREHIFHRVTNISSFDTFLQRVLGKHNRNRFCFMGSRTVTVASNGDIYPCHRFVGKESFMCGNVNTNDLDAEHMVHYLSEFNVDDIRSGCSHCWMRYLCSGTCYGEAMDENGTIARPNSKRCMINQGLISLAIEKVLHSRKALSGVRNA